ncbi:unnamed protein product [Zymoseptoria tritici ST99CH_1A5]|uniref:Uncharacterized protein n=1 Tax=Zymoseptoria tritici ST99CH_1A5 TaxID=1276529 RepID=A0A1Y6LDD3_ZYMTR|nr:unnamed protein product [Zymoseptoria tritici ST99CH_1A5]
MQIFQLSIASTALAGGTCKSGGSYGLCTVNGKDIPCTENSACSPSYPGDKPPCQLNSYNNEYADCYI